MMWAKVSLACSLGMGMVVIASAQDLTPGPGSQLVGQSCASCHSLDNVTQVRKSRADWDNTVHLMRNYGMDMSDDDVQKVIDYLSANYGLQAHKPGK